MKSYYQIYLSLVKEAIMEIEEALHPNKALSIDGRYDEVVSVLVNGQWDKATVLFVDGDGVMLSTYNGHDIELIEWAERASSSGDLFFLIDRIRALDPGAGYEVQSNENEWLALFEREESGVPYASPD